MKAAAIVNPQAGNGRARREWKALERFAAECFPGLTVLFTERPGHAVELARRCAGSGCELILAAGGDGTVNEVLNGMLSGGGDACLAVVPLGRGSDLARTWGVRDARTAIANAAAGPSSRVDVLLARFSGFDGARCEQYALNVAGFGLSAEAIRRMSPALRLLPPSLRYLAAAIPAVAAGHQCPLRLTLDDAPTIETGISLVALANGRFQGGGILIAPRASMVDGLIDITLVEPITLAELAANVRILYSGAIYTHPKVSHHRARRVLAESPSNVFLELDGDTCGTLPLETLILPGRLRLASAAPGASKMFVPPAEPRA